VRTASRISCLRTLDGLTLGRGIVGSFGRSNRVNSLWGLDFRPMRNATNRITSLPEVRR
jgi:hypothetical protein